jgi:nucleoside-diphosphate-sugar epimerase
VGENARASILETELEHKAGFPQLLARKTKYLAELEVERLKEGFPVRFIARRSSSAIRKRAKRRNYDGIYSLIHYLRKAPNLLRFVNVGNAVVKLNLVPVDFVVEGIAALATDENAVGATVALADPNPLTTEELFDAISRAMTGKQSIVKPPAQLVEKSLMLPFSPIVSGLPFPSVPYFFVPQTYDTRVADKLLARTTFLVRILQLMSETFWNSSKNIRNCNFSKENSIRLNSVSSGKYKTCSFKSIS